MTARPRTCVRFFIETPYGLLGAVVLTAWIDYRPRGWKLPENYRGSRAEFHQTICGSFDDSGGGSTFSQSRPAQALPMQGVREQPRIGGGRARAYPPPAASPPSRIAPVARHCSALVRLAVNHALLELGNDLTVLLLAQADLRGEDDEGQDNNCQGHVESSRLEGLNIGDGQ